jgi:hypothetical protein
MQQEELLKEIKEKVKEIKEQLKVITNLSCKNEVKNDKTKVKKKKSIVIPFCKNTVAEYATGGTVERNQRKNERD